LTDTSKILISPSIIASDLSMMGSIVSNFDKTIVDLLHMDVMDGNFVPNITFGSAYIRSLSAHTAIPLDIHLMIERPGDSIKEFIDLKPYCITFHYEADRFPARILKIIREAGILAGISINPSTPVEAIYDLLPYMDMVLIMSVDPGFYGQAFMETSINRIKKLSDHIKVNNYKIKIEVDGGINPENISRVVKAGATMIVAGNSAFKGNDVNKNVAFLKSSVQQ
jgi:ribulose-phosphate 3-epimerase